MNGTMRVAVSCLAVLGGLAAMGAPLVPTVAAQSAVRFFPRADNYPFSSAVQVGDVLYLSGQIGAAADERSVVPGGTAAETRRMMELIGQTLKEHGLTYGARVEMECWAYAAGHRAP